MSEEAELIEAIVSNDAERTRGLLARYPLAFRARTPEGTPILVARKHGAEDTLRVLLEVTPEDQLSLYEAAAVGNERRLKTILGQSRSRVDVPDANGDTPLGLAAAAGHADAVKVLLEHGADANRRTAPDRTPLAVALGQGHAGVADVLRAAGGRE